MVRVDVDDQCSRAVRMVIMSRLRQAESLIEVVRREGAGYRNLVQTGEWKEEGRVWAAQRTMKITNTQSDPTIA